MRGFLAAALVLAALSAAACDDNNTPIDPTPTTETVTDSFSGALTANGAQTHSFSSAAGPVSATLNALGPDDTLVIGIAMGTWNGTQCTLIVTNDKATKLSSVSGTATGTIDLCVRIYDVGNVTTPVTYTLDVTHQK